MDQTNACEFTIPARYYARRSTDWTSSVPAHSCGGEKVKDIPLSPANTVVLCMHCPNVGFGYPGAPEFLCDPAVAPYFNDVNERRKDMVQQVMAPFYQAARQIDMRMMYILAGWPAAENYESFREINARVILPSGGGWKPSPPPGPKSDTKDVFNPTGITWRKEFLEEAKCLNLKTTCSCDIPRETAATDRDWIVTLTQHASTILHENGIWNVLLVGTDATGCLLTTAGGLLSLAPLGFRMIVVEDCTESAEFPETRDARGTGRAMLKTMQMGGYCYLTDSQSVMAAMKAANAGKEVS